jgi:hypothetical protein
MLKKGELAKARNLRLLEVKSQKLLRDLIIYAIYLTFLFLVMSNNINPNYYNYKNSLSATFITDQYNGIGDINSFWTWSQNSLLDNVFGAKNSYSKNFEKASFMQDTTSYLVGHITIRQKRVKSKK